MSEVENIDDKPKRRQLLKGDPTIWVIVLLLCSISLVEVFSASSRLTFGKSSFIRPFLSHCGHISLGLVVMYLTHRSHYKWYKVINYLLVPISIILLIYLSVRGMNSTGAQRWIDLGFFNLQPSELGKITVVMSVAQWLSKLKPEDSFNQAQTFWKIVLFTGLVCLLIFGENLSTALLVAAVVYFMMIIGGIAGRRMIALTGVALLSGLSIAAMLLFIPPQTIRDSKIIPSRATTWQARLQDFFQTGTEGGKPNAYEYVRLVAPEKPQETHANIAIATSHVMGKGPGNSSERDYLQEASCDFIYAIIIEELGMIGGIGIMILYIVLLFRVGRIVSKCNDKYAVYLAIGIGLLLGMQAFINMSVAVGLIPVTGQPLPLISKGGTSVLMTGFCIGMLLGISNSLNHEAHGESMPGEEKPLPAAVDSSGQFGDQLT